MATYVIGDLQGCFDALTKLLKKIKFNKKKDKLIFCGDLVNRGGQSLAVLRWIFAHKKCCKVTLGNHDLSLLAQYYLPKIRKKKNQEFKQIFKADDCHTLMNWLCQQKILLEVKKYNVLIVHAGIYPSWSKKTAKKEALRVEKNLKNKPLKLFENMYGVKPNHWSKSLKGKDRTRFVINSFTRMRFLYKNNGLNFKAKSSVENFPKLIPWFEYLPRKKLDSTIIFGHWSALGLYSDKRVFCIDTGKVWGGQLTALKLENLNKKHKHIFQV
jgi:bis(5'-nucleosyl)-tetraphosphatase (symmetrical)